MVRCLLLKASVLNRKRDLALTRSIQYISENIHQNLKISKITEIANVSERTLEHTFLERFGISPKKYITRFKLNKVNKELGNLNSMELVSEVAKRLGFTHMGQFSADYKELFGELPSETLGNN